MALLALEMNAYITNLPPVGDRRLAFRTGLNSGPVIAGVTGRKKFAYDVWGDPHGHAWLGGQELFREKQMRNNSP